MACEDEKNDAFIRGINRQDMHHWKVMYNRYFAALCSYAAGILRDDTEAVEDLVQDVFLSIWNNKRSFADADELVNYLYRACYNNSLIYIRNNRIRHTILANMEFSESLDESDEFYTLALQEELIRQLHFYVDQLPLGQRRIIRLRLKGHTWNEIAEIMHLSLNTVKTQKQRSYKFLGERLSKALFAAFCLLAGM